MSYTAGIFEPDAFGLDLRDPVSMSREGGRGWGRAYKTMAGMNLALALFDKGYSTNDVLWAVRSANILYEAYDLECDHLDDLLCDEGIEMADDAPTGNETRSAAFGFYSELDGLLDDPTVGKSLTLDLLRDFLAFQGLDWVPAQFVPIELMHRASSGKMRTAMLIAHLASSEKAGQVHTELAKLLAEYPLIHQLLRAAVSDVESSLDGARFVTSHLQGEEPREGRKALESIVKAELL